MCNEGRKLNNTITNGIRTNRSVFKMDSPLRTSPFWLNFESLRRKNVKHSLWNKFSSPYDVPASALHTLSPVPSALSRHKRTAQSFHPVSPRPPRHSGAPRSSPSLRSMKWNTTIIRDPHYALTAVKRESDSVLRSADDQRIPYNSVEKERKESLMRRKLRTSRSAEVLDDVLDSIEISCWGSRRRISEMSKSTDELEKVRNQWLKKLDQYKIHRGSSKSDESLNMLTDVDVHVTPQPLDGLLAVKVQPNKFSSLSRIKSNFWNTELDHKPLDAEAVIFDYQKQETTECRDIRNHLKYENAKKRLELEKVTEQERRENSRSGGGQGAETRKMIGTNDHPLLTVRPGVHLARSRSCGSRANKRVLSSYSEPDSYSQNSRKSSVSFSLGEAETMHTKNDGNHRISTTESPQRVIDTADSERDEENVIIEHITEVPKLRFHKYNLRRRPVKHDWSLPAPTCHHTFPGVSTDQVDGQRVRCSPDHCSYEGETLINGKQITVQTLDDPCRFFSARRRLFRSSLSPRSRSVDRMRTSLYQTHLSGKDRCFTQGPEDGVGLDPKIPALVSEDESGFCRGIIFDGSTSARTGIFPASLVARRETQVGGMSGRGKPTAAVKVSPPTVPDSTGVTHRHSGSSFSSGVYSAGDQRSSYSSSVSDENPPPSPRSPARGGGGCDHGQLGRLGSGGGGGGGSGNGGSGNNNNTNNNNNSSGSPTHYHNNNNNQQQQQFTFPAQPHQQQMPQFAHLMCPKTSPGSPHHVPPDGTYTYLTYQHQTSLEDQGIDVQSPGRSSPGSGSGSSTTGSTASSGGCRNSTTSLDSGRASTTTQSHQHRLSGQSYDSGSILRHSYHSSSSSLGSMEHDAAIHVNVPELLNNGVRDSEVLRAWLTDLRFEEYYEKFISAGYDMPTISRMTPEDLNAIGITKPAHRKKLKAEITRLNISDGLPDFIPNRLEDWLSMLRLEEYTASLKQQNYTSVEQMTQLTWEDLEDIGITKLGHQKKVMLAIKRAKDIMAGKKFTNTQDPRQQSIYGTHEIMISRESSEGRDQYTSVPEFHTFAGPPHYGNGEHNRLSGPADSGVHYGVPTHYAPGVQYGPVPPPQAHVHPMPQHSGPFHPSGQFSAPQGPSPPGSKLPNGPPHPLLGSSQVQYRPDVVAVQVRSSGRGRSIESLEEPIYGTYQTFHPESRMPLIQGPMSLGSLPPRPFPPTTLGSSHPQRSMDDGDITPTNEYANNYEGGGTLPRPRTANKLRPVAKVTAKTRVDIHEVPQFIKDGMNLKKPSQAEEINMKELNLKTLNRQNSEKMYNSSQGSGSTNNTPQGTPKKIPPPPPRRSNSISETSKEAASQESQYAYLRRGLSYGYMGIKNNLQPDVTPDLPPPPAPPDSANHQHLPDDFPPPPPPLTCVTMASSTRISASSTITTSSITSDSMTTSQTSTTSSEDDVSSGFRPRRNDSNASFKSTSSTDSESLPFANENAGTIKQRACRPHPGLSVLDSRNSPHSSPRSSPALRRKETQPPLRPNPVAATDSSTVQLTKSNSSSPDGTGDVLNDIGNMLANLTDELDAMLEQEVILKN